MRNDPTPTPTQFQPNDNVRLLQPHGDVCSGTLGRILGRFARETGPTYVVSFEGDHVRISGDVRSEEIVSRRTTSAPPPPSRTRAGGWHDSCHLATFSVSRAALSRRRVNDRPQQQAGVCGWWKCSRRR